MPAPSPLAIATSVVQRLVKEETSYHKELKSQEARLEKLVSSTEADENKEYQLKQEVSYPTTFDLKEGFYIGLG
jgi:tubulin-specific chaperone A